METPNVKHVEESSFPPPSVDTMIEGIGEMIGPYRLIENLGKGGFGEVWRAEQRTPFRRTVALKLIKLGMDTRDVIARFEAERQALALLDHPNIAHVFDAGTTTTGRPYFVMEYVEGKRITKYCDDNKLSIDDRLRLFSQVCDAIQHAHEMGIIHRDIKPSNVLVTVCQDKPRAVVIDFGVAKALSQPLTEQTLFTQRGQPLGTPAYMSPEQAEMTNLDIDARSDVYSLGVLLYELLTGTLPFDPDTLERAAVAEMQRIICEEEPPCPSTKLSGLGERATILAEHRRTAVTALAKRLHEELEWIPLMAMRKERERRYRTVNDLAEDVQNYLEDRPLTAGPESLWYRLHKCAHRHSYDIRVGSLVFVILVGSLLIIPSLVNGPPPTNITSADPARWAVFQLFLNAWQDGKAAEAEVHQAVLAGQFPDSREVQAATFLLDPRSLEEKEADFKNGFVAQDPAFWYFVLGEHYAKKYADLSATDPSGQSAKEADVLARDAYGQCVKESEGNPSNTDNWYIDRARAKAKALAPPS